MTDVTPAHGILADYHTHPKRTPADLPIAQHAAHYVASMRPYAARAAELGLAELGMSEHIYRLSLAPGAVPWRTDGTARGDMAAYVRAVEAVRAEFSQPAPGRPALAVRLSMEVDIVPATVSILQQALPLYPFDYLLGSVHEIPDIEAGARSQDSYRAYYGAIRWAAKSRLFHTIAHPDRIHRKLDAIPTGELEALMAETAATLAVEGVCIELSANGVRRGIVGTDPNRTFIQICFRHGVGITFGSDAHVLDDVAVGLDVLRDLAWEAGYRHIATFDHGRRIDRPLPPP